MTMIHGKEGSVTFAGGGELAEITDFSLDVGVDLAEVTNMNSTSDAKEYLAGFYGWTASVTAFIEASPLTPVLTLAAAALVLTSKTGVTYTGDAFCTGCSVSQTCTDGSSVTYSFTGNGVIA